MGRCGLVGIVVALFEEVCITVGVGFEVSSAQATSSEKDHFLLPASRLPFQHHVYLHATMSHHDGNGLNL